MSDDRMKCFWCQQPGTEVDLRRYGPGGSMVCYPCATTPERQAQTRENFGKVLDAALSKGVPVFTDRGVLTLPVPKKGGGR